MRITPVLQTHICVQNNKHNIHHFITVFPVFFIQIDGVFLFPRVEYCIKPFRLGKAPSKKLNTILNKQGSHIVVQLSNGYKCFKKQKNL